MKRKPLLYLFAAFIVFGSFAQIQTGVVKTPGRKDNVGNVIPGIHLDGVVVKNNEGRTVVSNKDGKFSFPISTKVFFFRYYLKPLSKKRKSI